MSVDQLEFRARELWREVAAAPIAFGAAGTVSVAVSPESRLCPHGWLGIVLLGDAAIVTAPDAAQAAAARTAFAKLPLAEVVDPAALGAVLPLDDALGPVALGYLAAADFRPAPGAETSVTRLPAHHPDVIGLERSAGEQDTNEASLHEVTSPVFVVRAEGGEVAAAAGYRRWPSRTAHISILTHPGHRGRGLARTTGTAATRHALDAGLLPQWRARVPASRRVAAALGFRELGWQLSVRQGTVTTG